MIRKHSAECGRSVQRAALENLLNSLLPAKSFGSPSRVTALFIRYFSFISLFLYRLDRHQPLIDTFCLRSSLLDFFHPFLSVSFLSFFFYYYIDIFLSIFFYFYQFLFLCSLILAYSDHRLLSTIAAIDFIAVTMPISISNYTPTPTPITRYLTISSYIHTVYSYIVSGMLLINTAEHL